MANLLAWLCLRKLTNKKKPDEIIRQNSRYTYLQIKEGLTAQICNSCLDGYKPKTRAKKKTDKINLLNLL